MRTDAIMTAYPDNGCRFSLTCLTCPLSRCVYEAPQELRSVMPRDFEMSAAHDRGMSIDKIAIKFGELHRDRVRQAITRARLFDRRPPLDVPARNASTSRASRAMDVRVRVHLSAKPKPQRRPVTRPLDWHNRVVILRAWGFSLAQIGYAADGLHHSSIINHLKGRCKCGQPVTRYQNAVANFRARVVA